MQTYIKTAGKYTPLTVKNLPEFHAIMDEWQNYDGHLPSLLVSFGHVATGEITADYNGYDIDAIPADPLTILGLHRPKLKRGILIALARGSDQHASPTVIEIGRGLGTPKSTIYGHLVAMEHHGLVYRDPRTPTRNWRLSLTGLEAVSALEGPEP